jgi:hypothetical protein
MKSDDESIARVGFHRDARTGYGEKGISDGKSRALIAVDERMVLREASDSPPHNAAAPSDQVAIISGLGRFEHAAVAHACKATVAVNLRSGTFW